MQFKILVLFLLFLFSILILTYSLQGEKIEITGRLFLGSFSFVGVVTSSVLLLSLAYQLSKREGGKLEERDVETCFSIELFRSIYDLDSALDVIEKYKDRSMVARAIASEKKLIGSIF